MALQFKIPFQFKVAIKQYHEKECHIQFLTQNKALKLVNFCCQLLVARLQI